MTYERKIGRVLKEWAASNGGELHSGQWISFHDANGFGYAQPDYYLVYPEQLLLVECKLTQSSSAKAQCLGLYAPLLEFIYKRPITSIQCFKHWRHPESTPALIELKGAMRHPGGYFLWHNLA